MESNKKPWPLKTIHGIKKRINTNPDFQRPAVWGKAQKQLLIDTILRNYDVPKLYWRKTGAKPDTYDVIDGQQRLRAIWSFFDGQFRLPKDADPIDKEQIADLCYEELPDDLRMQFDGYALDVVVIENSDEEEVREMFLRLQNGTTLKAQEKRNAYPGKMRNFVRDLTEHPFFTRVDFNNSRFTHDLVAAQLTCLELAGGPTSIKNADLNKMYETNLDFDTKSAEARSIRKTLDLMYKIFSERTPELVRYNVIAIYCLISELQHQFVFIEIQDQFKDWFFSFEQKRIAEDQLPDEDADSEWRSYKEKISHSTDAGDSIRWRTEFLMRNLLESFPTLQRKDNQRNFTHLQKLAIFRRDQGVCQVRIKCNGNKLSWDDWHCDHKTPWSKGGKTTVKNGQVACSSCNLQKSNT